MGQRYLRSMLALLFCSGVGSAAGIDLYEQAMRDYQAGLYPKALRVHERRPRGQCASGRGRRGHVRVGR
jgi:hypothetical protein